MTRPVVPASAFGSRWWRGNVAWFLVLALGACGPPAAEDLATKDPTEDPAVPPLEASTEVRPSARPELMATLRADLETPRHSSDGAGRAWLELVAGQPPTAEAGRPGQWTIHFEAGPEGIVEGGAIYLQVSPFWGWSTPQVDLPSAPGYTSVATSAPGVELEAVTLDQQLLGVTIRGRALAAGERMTLVYGAGVAGAMADRFAEQASRFWIAVDGDGDGVRQILPESPSVVVEPGDAARVMAHLPSTARPGETVRLRLAVLDARGNAGLPWRGRLRLRVVEGEGVLQVPSVALLEPSAKGVTQVEAQTLGPGVVRVAVEALGDDRKDEPLVTESNPLQVTDRGQRVLWGDLQNHSGDSDGTGLPEELYRYARDVAALDVFSLTDHDHWGMEFLDQRPAQWRALQELSARYYDPGAFVTLLGFEWTHWVHGHRHVVYFDDDGPLLSSLDPATDTPVELWAALRGRRAITIAHHSAGGPVATDWSQAPDPELEPVTEIVSVHGVSEAADSPSLIHRPVAGNFVRDALARGYRFGFVGSSDGHDGHPGLAHLASPTGGVVAILADELTRDAVYEALRARRVYATSGPRMILRVTFGGEPQGALVSLVDGRQRDPSPIPGIPADALVAQVIAPGPLAGIELIRSGQVVDGVDCGGERRCGQVWTFGDLAPGEYLYLRITQVDGGLAWTSPFYFVEG